MTKRIAINGFGRIGRLTLRNLLKNKDVEVVAINDLTDTATLAHLFKYDSSQGMYPGKVEANNGHIIIGNKKIMSISERDPAKLPWKKLKVDIVLECTGVFRTAEDAGKHIEAGAKRVVISAPGSGADIQTIVLGVNDEQIDPEQTIYSNASCTTNCLAPLVKIIDENFGFVQGNMTTTHAYTADQNIQDGPHKDLRRARAAAFNIVPTSTGAASALAKVYPKVKGKVSAMAVRVPVITGSLIELDVMVEKAASAEAINKKFKSAASGKMKGIVEYSEAHLVSSDIIGNTSSAVFDSLLTESSGNLIKIIGWYDNEAGYSARLADLAVKIANLPAPKKSKSSKLETVA